MTDPLSITASVLALLAAAQTAINTIHDIYKAPQQLQELKAELEYLNCIVSDLANSPMLSVPVNTDVPGHLKEAKLLISQIQSFVEQCSLQESSGIKCCPTLRIRRLAWAMARRKAARLTGKLRKMRDTLVMDISIWTLISLGNLTTSLAASKLSNSQMVQGLKDNTDRLQLSVKNIESSVRGDQLAFIRYLRDLHMSTGLDALPWKHSRQLTQTATQLVLRPAKVASPETRREAPEPDSVRSDDDLSERFYDCMSTLSHVTHEEAQSRSMDWTLERSSVFFPEGYTIDHEWGPSLFIYSRTSLHSDAGTVETYVLHFVQTPRHWRWVSLTFTGSTSSQNWASHIIPPGINGRMVEATPTIRTRLKRYMEAIEADETDVQVLVKDQDGDTSDTEVSPSSITVRDRRRPLPHDLLEDVFLADKLGWPQFLETEIITRKRYWYNSCLVIAESKECFHRLFPSPLCRTSDAYKRFIYELQALNAVRDSRLVVRPTGVVLDDARSHLKGYLLATPSTGWTDLTDKLTSTTPWAVRERWARYIVAAVAEFHAEGFQIGAIDLNCFVLDGNEIPHLLLANANKYRSMNADGEVPPEFRRGLRLRQEWAEPFPTQEADLFRVGMMLWLLGNGQPVPVSSSFCQFADCDYKPRSRCAAEHVNPVMLPPCEDPDVPAYYQGIIAACRTRNPRYRKRAASLLALFPSEAELDSRAAEAARTQADSQVAGYPPGYSMWCDECDKIISGGSYRCDICNCGNFDLCLSCADQGLHCRDDSHVLEWEEYVNGEMVRTFKRPPLLSSGPLPAD